MSEFQKINGARDRRIVQLYFTRLWTQKELAELYGVSQPTIHRAITKYYNWM